MRRVLLWIGITVVVLFVLFLVLGIVLDNCTDVGTGEESPGISESSDVAVSTPTLRPAISTPPSASTPTRPPVEPPTPTSTPLPVATPTPTSTPLPVVTPTPTSTPRPVVTPTPTSTPLPVVTPTPTFRGSLQALTLCERVSAQMSMLWGQAPGVIYSDDPRVTGRIEQGDYVRFLTPPNEDGLVRVQVYPHDGRPVGQSEGKVWIDWGQLERFRLDLDMFSCED